MKSLHICFFIICFTTISFAQVGINTTLPNAQLDIVSNDKGVLVPRIALVAKNSPDPVVTPEGNVPENSTLVYNTSTVAGENPLSPGFYYWHTNEWIPIGGPQSKDWISTGNEGTDPAENFIGTLDNAPLSFRTNNEEKLRIATNNQVLAMQGGSASHPFYSWYNDNDTGMWRESSEVLALGTGGIESITINNANTTNRSTTINNDQEVMDFKVKTSGHANTLHVDGNSDNVGIKTDAPAQALHVAGNNATVRVESLNTANNNNNNPADPAPVYVNNDGDLTLQPPLVQTYMAVDEVDFLSTTTLTNNGSGQVINLYSTEITLTQESLVHINYQFSVSVSRSDGTVLTDGASRLFRSGILVNDSNIHLGYSTGTYTNNPSSGTGGTYASGFYYLSGQGYVQLPAGTHTLTLDVLGFGGSFDFQMKFGETNQDRFQVVVHR